MSAVILESVLTCPQCGHAQQETMPTDACQFYYECTACHTLLHPKPGDCCVFCSFGSVPCPPINNNVVVAQADKSRAACLFHRLNILHRQLAVLADCIEHHLVTVPH